MAISFIIYSAMDYLLLTPLELQQQQLLKQIQTTQTENNQIEIQALAVTNSNRNKTDPNLSVRQQLDRLNRELVIANRSIEAAVAGLITPERMPIALENMLRQQKGLQFISLENLPAKPLLADSPDEAGAQKTTTIAESIPTQKIYQHSFRIQFEGSYLNTLAYLRQLEGLEWRFRWDEIDLTMLEYPTVHITVVIHTISLDEGVIGV